MLRNKVYIAIIQWNQIYNPQGQIPKLVDDRTFYAVQTILDGRKDKRSYRRDAQNPHFPLRVFSNCTRCGSSMTGSYSKGRNRYYSYYRCPRCHNSSVSKDVYEAEFVEFIQSYQPTDTIIELFSEAAKEVFKRQTADHQKRRKELLAKEEVVKAERIKIVKLGANDVIDEALPKRK